MLVVLALHRVRRLLDGDLRLRAACDFQPIGRDEIVATRPGGFALPSLVDIEAAMKEAIASCKGQMENKVVVFEGDLKKGKDDKARGDKAAHVDNDGGDEDEDDGDDNGTE